MTNTTYPSAIDPLKDEIATLIKDGWREFSAPFGRQYAIAFYKRFEATQCRRNKEEPGIQIELYLNERGGRPIFELEMTGEIADETSIRILNYSLPHSAAEVMALVPRMLAGWEAMANPTAIPTPQNFGLCRDCAHWQPTERVIEGLAECPRDIHPDHCWPEAVCQRIQQGLDITASGG